MLVAIGSSGEVCPHSLDGSSPLTFPNSYTKNKSEAGIASILVGPGVYQHGFGDPRLDPRISDHIVVSNPDVI